MRRTLADPAVLAELVARFRALTATQPRVWGSMNAQQMALHVGDASAAVLKQRPFSSRARKPSAFRKFLLLNVLPRMPRGFRSGAEPAKQAHDPVAFARDVDRAVNLLTQMSSAPPDALVDQHPIFGSMNRANWMRWAYMHTDHHLRQFGV